MGIKINPLPPIERLNELLEYDEVTGVIRWRVNRSRTAKVGVEAGHVQKDTGYRLIGIDRQNWVASRIAWALHYGVDPYPVEVDHKNRRRAENWLGNLRLATRAEQLDNRDKKIDRPVRITYPDGEVYIAPSVKVAAEKLGKKRPALQGVLKRGGVLCYEGEKKGVWVDSGIRLAYVE